MILNLKTCWLNMQSESVAVSIYATCVDVQLFVARSESCSQQFIQTSFVVIAIQLQTCWQRLKCLFVNSIVSVSAFLLPAFIQTEIVQFSKAWILLERKCDYSALLRGSSISIFTPDKELMNRENFQESNNTLTDLNDVALEISSVAKWPCNVLSTFKPRCVYLASITTSRNYYQQRWCRFNSVYSVLFAFAF